MSESCTAYTAGMLLPCLGCVRTAESLCRALMSSVDMLRSPLVALPYFPVLWRTMSRNRDMKYWLSWGPGAASG